MTEYANSWEKIKAETSPEDMIAHSDAELEKIATRLEAIKAELITRAADEGLPVDSPKRTDYNALIAERDHLTDLQQEYRNDIRDAKHTIAEAGK